MSVASRLSVSAYGVQLHLPSYLGVAYCFHNFRTHLSLITRATFMCSSFVCTSLFEFDIVCVCASVRACVIYS
jgi:hypothetical protein